MRYDLSDFEWSVIQPLVPNKPRGVPRVDDRRVLNGIFWVLRSGAPLAKRSIQATFWSLEWEDVVSVKLFKGARK